MNIDDGYDEIRSAVRALCAQFPDEYFRKIDLERGYPEEFVRALTDAGWLAALIPQEYGGSGLSLAEASVIMEEINRSGGNSGACHGQMYVMNVLVRHGSQQQREFYLPKIASGELRLQSMAVTEPTTGTDTTKLKTTAVRKGDRYVINGQKIWTSRALYSDLMLLLARTTPLDQVKRKTDGLTLFYTKLDRAKVEVRLIHKMGRHGVDSNMLFFDGLEVPEEDRIGAEGEGFRLILHGLNPERILIAGEAVGIGQAALSRAANYARTREVFGRPIGQNQGIQHPLAKSWMELEAAHLMVQKAAWLYDQGLPCAAEANSAKFLAAEACYHACENAIFTHGGMGYAKEYHVERYLRESWIPRLAPVSPQLILCFIAEKVLGLPKSY